MAPEYSYLLSGGPLPTERPKWMAAVEDPERVRLVAPAPVPDSALVDVSEPMHVDSEGRLMFEGRAWHGCCLEAADSPHGDCDLSQFVDVPKGPSKQRTFIPHNSEWRKPGR